MEFSALATGLINADLDTLWVDLQVYTNDPQTVADLLHKKFGLKIDEIILTENGEESPEINYHWRINEDYFAQCTL